MDSDLRELRKGIACLLEEITTQVNEKGGQLAAAYRPSEQGQENVMMLKWMQRMVQKMGELEQITEAVIFWLKPVWLHMDMRDPL